MRVKSFQTPGMLEQFPERGSVTNCCHPNLYQNHLLPSGQDCILKAFLSYVAYADIWKTASSISVQFWEKNFSNLLARDLELPGQLFWYEL